MLDVKRIRNIFDMSIWNLLYSRHYEYPEIPFIEYNVIYIDNEIRKMYIDIFYNKALSGSAHPCLINCRFFIIYRVRRLSRIIIFFYAIWWLYMSSFQDHELKRSSNRITNTNNGTLNYTNKMSGLISKIYKASVIFNKLLGNMRGL